MKQSTGLLISTCGQALCTLTSSEMVVHDTKFDRKNSVGLLFY